VRLRIALVALLCAPAAARAAPCNTPELLYTLPGEGATGVPTDAALVAAYASSAEYLGEEVVLVPDGAEPRPLVATFDRAQALLSVKLREGLQPGLAYAVRWPGLRGVDTATPGLGREVRFTAGLAPDAEAPQFEGVRAVRWDLERKRNNCTESIEERLVFDVELGAAGDDGGRASLALVVFQTAGPLVTAPVPVLTRALPADGVARVTLPTSRAVGRICFAALARDLTGKVSASADRESCVMTTAPPFFRGCALAGRQPGGGGAGLALALACLVVRARRRRRGS
jgi:hypothetical protein